MKGTTQGDGVYLATEPLIPASDDETGAVDSISTQSSPQGVLSGQDVRQTVLVGVADLLEDRGSGLCHGGLAIHHGKESELVLHDVGDSLCIGS